MQHMRLKEKISNPPKPAGSAGYIDKKGGKEGDKWGGKQFKFPTKRPTPRT